MGRHNLEYPTGARNSVNREKSRATYDLQRINTIIQASPIVHVSFSPSPSDPFPVILPMIGFMADFDSPSAGLDEPLDCYLHGYVSSRIMNLTRKAAAGTPGESGDTGGLVPGKGLPVCLASSKVDGLILSLTPNSHSYNYRSAVLFGYATLVTALDEKLWAMEQITNKVVPGRWAQTRVPPNGAEMSSTQIMRVRIESGSGKIRDYGPHDEKADVDDEELKDRVWTGFVPLVERFEEPVPSTYNKVKEVPGYLTSYLEATNEESKEYMKETVARVIT